MTLDWSVGGGLALHGASGVVMIKGGWVYVLCSRPHGVLYVGVTADLVRRVFEHREGLVAGFTKKYSVTRLVCFERHEEIVAAIAREKVIKHWTRAQKVRLIEVGNVEWRDLWGEIVRFWRAGSFGARKGVDTRLGRA